MFNVRPWEMCKLTPLELEQMEDGLEGALRRRSLDMGGGSG